MKESAKLEIEQQKEKAVAAIREQVASLSVLIASKVIEKELSAADQDKLINDYIQEAGESDEQTPSVAKRYALALFQIAKEQKLLDQVEEELRVVKEVFNHNPTLKLF